MIIKRVIFSVLLFLSIFVFPWWTTALLAFIGIFVFKHFYEFIGAGIITYAIYSIPGSNITPFLFALIISVVYICIQIFRRYIILYKNDISY
jgi:hypothetical protein